MTAYTEHKAKLKREGYEEAMLDIARKMQEDPSVMAGGALTWIFDNTHPDTEAHTIAADLKATRMHSSAVGLTVAEAHAAADWHDYVVDQGGRVPEHENKLALRLRAVSA